MAKYSFQFKKKIVEEYFSGKGDFEFIAKNTQFLIQQSETGFMVTREMEILHCYGLEKTKITLLNTNFLW